MGRLPKHKMTAEEFVAWSMDLPDGQRYELTNGEIVAMASERSRHARVKGRVFRRLEEAVEKTSLRCVVYPDGMAVRIDDHTVYEPDAAVRCGEPMPGDQVLYDDPVIVVEVLSPSTMGADAGDKFDDYFRLPSIRHYLIVRTNRPVVVHHERLGDGTIQSRILASGELRLEPPGLSIDVASLFPDD